MADKISWQQMVVEANWQSLCGSTFSPEKRVTACISPLVNVIAKALLLRYQCNLNN
jgi:hypothetical protein